MAPRRKIILFLYVVALEISLPVPSQDEKKRRVWRGVNIAVKTGMIPDGWVFQEWREQIADTHVEGPLDEGNLIREVAGSAVMADPEVKAKACEIEKQSQVIQCRISQDSDASLSLLLEQLGEPSESSGTLADSHKTITNQYAIGGSGISSYYLQTESTMSGQTQTSNSTCTSEDSTQSSGEIRMRTSSTLESDLMLDEEGKIKPYVDFSEFDDAFQQMSEEQRTALINDLRPRTM